VEFLLFKHDGTTPIDSLQLWIDAREPHTEYYLVGIDGQIRDYPSEFSILDGQVISVRYGTGEIIDGELGEIILGIVNREEQSVTYQVRLTIDDRPVDITHNGVITNELVLEDLSPGEKWEGVIGFAPQYTGVDQKVEFLLFTGDDATPADSLAIWINVY
jgi:uncharacterized membrane protein